MGYTSADTYAKMQPQFTKEVNVMAKDKPKKSTPEKRRHKLMMRLKAGPVTYDELYESGLYDLDTKTLDRDKKHLHDDFDVEIDCKNQVYSLKSEGRFVFSLEFSEQEAEALALGLKIVAHFLPHMDSSLLKAWRKLRAYIPDEAREHAEAMREFTQILGSAAGIDAKVFGTLTEALRDKKNVDIRYIEAGQPTRMVTVTPNSIRFENGLCCLEAASPETGRNSLYALSGIQSARLDEDEPTDKEDKS